MIDLHVHTARCGHATGSIEEYVAAARARDITTMAFSDHLPLLDGPQSDYAMCWDELDEYVAEVLALASAHADSGPEILLGIEADWMPGREADTAAVLEAHPFDVVLGSIHMLDGWAFDDPRLREGYEEWTPDALWEAYFDALCDAAASGLFDVMAHPDLVKKFAYWPAADPTPLYERAAEAFLAGDAAVEVNTAGARKPAQEIYPSEAFLRVCASAGVPATIGSDAHDPSEVGMDFEAGVALLRRSGYESVFLYRERRAVEVPLP
jgi:histidinol-phosphatase (PHP family)